MINIKTYIQNIKNGKDLLKSEYSPFNFLDEIMDIYKNQTIPENWTPVNFKQDTEKMVKALYKDILADFQSRAINLQDYNLETPRNRLMLWVAMYDMILIRFNPYSHDYEKTGKEKYSLLRVGLGGLGKATDLAKESKTGSYRCRFIEQSYFDNLLHDGVFKNYGPKYTIKPCTGWIKQKLISNEEMHYLDNERTIIKQFAETLVLIDKKKEEIIYKTVYKNTSGPVSR